MAPSSCFSFLCKIVIHIIHLNLFISHYLKKFNRNRGLRPIKKDRQNFLCEQAHNLFGPSLSRSAARFRFATSRSRASPYKKGQTKFLMWASSQRYFVCPFLHCSCYNENWLLYSWAYWPACARSSSWLPCSMIFPSFMKRITSADWMVDSLWATMKLVLPFIMAAKAFWIFISVLVSMDEVASVSYTHLKSTVSNDSSVPHLF